MNKAERLNYTHFRRITFIPKHSILDTQEPNNKVTECLSGHGQIVRSRRYTFRLSANIRQDGVLIETGLIAFQQASTQSAKSNEPLPYGLKIVAEGFNPVLE